MCNTAAFLTDRVLPDQPIRQWVLSVPFGLRLLLASRAEAFTALTRIFMEEVLSWYRQSVALVGVPHARGGAVSVQHRFGGAEPDRARELLEQLGLPADPPPCARARSPTFEPDPPTEDW